jgi:hypothetical protein
MREGMTIFIKSGNYYPYELINLEITCNERIVKYRKSIMRFFICQGLRFVARLAIWAVFALISIFPVIIDSKLFVAFPGLSHWEFFIEINNHNEFKGLIGASFSISIAAIYSVIIFISAKKVDKLNDVKNILIVTMILIFIFILIDTVTIYVELQEKNSHDIGSNLMLYTFHFYFAFVGALTIEIMIGIFGILNNYYYNNNNNIRRNNVIKHYELKPSESFNMNQTEVNKND